MYIRYIILILCKKINKKLILYSFFKSIIRTFLNKKEKNKINKKIK